MLTKQGVALTFYAMFIASKVGKTGLTVTVDVLETTSGTPIVSGGSATELAGGLYYYTLSSGSVDASGAYIAVFKTADTSVDQQHIPAIWVTDTELKNLDATVSSRSTVTTAQVNAEVDTALADAGVTTTVTGRIDAAVSSRLAAADYAAAPTAADVADAVWDEASAGHTTVGSTGAALTAAGGAGDPWSVSTGTAYASDTFGGHVKSITPGAVTIVSPVATDGTSITLIRGDDYLNADNRALTFSGDSWPTLTGGDVALIVDISGTPTSYAGTITGAGECYVELTDTQTAALTPGAYNYDLQATLDNVTTSIVTLVQGLLLVTADVR